MKITNIGTLMVMATPIVGVVACSKENKKTGIDNTENISFNILEDIISKKMLNFSGSVDQGKMRKYIKGQMKEVGLNTTSSEKAFTYNFPVGSSRAKSVLANTDFKQANEAKYNEIKAAIDAGTKTPAINNIPGINLEFTINGNGTAEEKEKIIAIGAHYDLHSDHLDDDTASQAVNDNRSGLASLLAITKYLAKNPIKNTIKILFWDAEENGINGSKEYVKSITDKSKWLKYINLDSVAGGDFIYIGHGFDDKRLSNSRGKNSKSELYSKAMRVANENGITLRTSWVQGANKNSAYAKFKIKVDKDNNGSFTGDETTPITISASSLIKDTTNIGEFKILWDHDADTATKKINVKTNAKEVLTNMGTSLDMLVSKIPFQKGEMYPASDHVSFNAVGIEVIGFEGTNYDIHGDNGKDGYSQTINKSFWYPFTKEEWIKNKNSEASYTITDAQKTIGIKGGFYNKSEVNANGYDRKFENGFGRIWHTKLDRFDNLEKRFKGRIAKQLLDIYTVVIKTITN